MELSPGARAMAGGAFSFSVMALLVKLAGRTIPSQEIVLVRSVVMLALGLAVIRRQRISLRTTRYGLHLLRGLLGFGALSCFFYSLVHLPLADATVIQYTNPAFTTLFAAIALRERIRVADAIMLLASLAGVLLITRPDFLFGGTERLDPTAVAIALSGAILSAAAYVSVRRLSATEPTMVIVFWFAALSGAASLAFPSATSVVPSGPETLLLLGVGISTYGGQVLITRGLSLQPAGRAAAIGYIQIVFAAVWSALFFRTWPDAWSAAGALLVVGSTLVLVMHPRAGAQALPVATASTLPVR